MKSRAKVIGAVVTHLEWDPEGAVVPVRSEVGVPGGPQLLLHLRVAVPHLAPIAPVAIVFEAAPRVAELPREGSDGEGRGDAEAGH